MQTKNKEQNLNTGLKIGFLTISAYLVNYVLRNLLSVSTPYMLQGNDYSTEYIGLISSLFFITYALGQLVNGFLGEQINSKYMIGCGLAISGLSTFCFPLFKSEIVGIILFAIMGFGMSMLRGPLMKIISENTLPKAARLICTFFSMVAFAGPFLASALIILFTWDVVFMGMGVFAILYGITTYIIIAIFQRKGTIATTTPQKKEKTSSGIKDLLKVKHFVYYLIMAGLMEVATSSISFWIPTYLTEFLSINPDLSALLFSISSFLRALAPFITLFLFERLRGNDMKINKYSYLISAVGFIIMAFVKLPVLNVFVLIISLIAVSCASSILWSIFIPSLAKTGKTSTANGILDFTGYAVAAVANIFFGNAVGLIGWRGLIFVWSALMAVGVVFSIIESKKFDKKARFKPQQ